MASNKSKPVSYRRNRDYSTHFKWTYELNCEPFFKGKNKSKF